MPKPLSSKGQRKTGFGDTVSMKHSATLASIRPLAAPCAIICTMNALIGTIPSSSLINLTTRSLHEAILIAFAKRL